MNCTPSRLSAHQLRLCGSWIENHPCAVYNKAIFHEVLKASRKIFEIALIMDMKGTTMSYAQYVLTIAIIVSQTPNQVCKEIVKESPVAIFSKVAKARTNKS